MTLDKKQQLMGSRKSESRFGTTIADAGDLNRDGYTDVAIGAVNEDDVGAVYIYHGSAEGILPDFVQKISAAEVTSQPSGFGISISRGKDVDDNYYPDLLIGSYLSDQAFLYRTRPIVRVIASIEFDPSQIQRNPLCEFNGNSAPCFNVTTCLKYGGNDAPPELEFSTQLVSARKGEVLERRKYLAKQNTLHSVLPENFLLGKEKSKCFSYRAFIEGDHYDVITPVRMALGFKIVHKVDTDKEFCKSCPVLDGRSPSPATDTIVFENGCGSDNICHSDLKLKAYVHGLSSGELVVGVKNDFAVVIELKNVKEPAYMTEVNVSLPTYVQIINHGDCREESQNEIVCKAGNPLEDGRTVKFQIKLEVSSLPDEIEQIGINVTASTKSQEIDDRDNEVELKFPVKLAADMAILGHANVEQIVLDEKNKLKSADFSHTYTVMKFLPGSVKSVEVEMAIPVTTAANIKFLQFKSIAINEDSSTSVIATCKVNGRKIQQRKRSASKLQENDDLLVLASEDSPNTTEPTTTNDDDKDGVGKVLDCSNSKCTKVSCVSGPFVDDGATATFRIFGTLNINSLREVLENNDKVSIITEGKVSIVEHRANTRPSNDRPDETKVITSILRVVPPQPEKMASWILIVSIVAGILLLVLILLTLIKFGFFRRKKREDLQRLKEQTGE